MTSERLLSFSLRLARAQVAEAARIIMNTPSFCEGMTAQDRERYLSDCLDAMKCASSKLRESDRTELPRERASSRSSCLEAA
jgi:hypothetical protein